MKKLIWLLLVIPSTYGIADLITLDQAIQLAQEQSPQLQASHSSVLATSGTYQQSTLLPNPDFSVYAENVGGNGSEKTFDTPQVTYSISQRIEIGGKRSARKEEALQGYQVAKYTHQANNLKIIRDVTIAFNEVVSADQKTKLAEDQHEMALEMQRAVIKRVEAAADSLFQKNKAEVTVAKSLLALETAKRELAIAKKQLLILWGMEFQECEAFQLDPTQFFYFLPPEEMDFNIENPHLAIFSSELERNRALVSLEQANAIPDPSLSFGYRNFPGTSDYTFVVGVSIPIPLWNRNQGNIFRAKSNMMRAEYLKQQADLDLELALTKNYQEQQADYLTITKLKETIIPAAKNSFSWAFEAYQKGRLTYLEVLDAQRTLFEVQSEFNQFLKNYQNKRAELDYFLATHITEGVCHE